MFITLHLSFLKTGYFEPIQNSHRVVFCLCRQKLWLTAVFQHHGFVCKLARLSSRRES